MSNLAVHFSSASNEWATPQAFFDQLNAEFNFTLDPCATPATAKCKKFFTEADDGLSKPWENERVFCNPPYGRVLKNWVRKAAETRGGGGGRLIDTCPDRHKLLPRSHIQQARRGNKIYQRAVEVWGRQSTCTFSFNGCGI